jgi:hypothetical protein
MPELASFRRRLCAALMLALLAAAGLAATAHAEYGEITHFGAFGKGEAQFDTEEEESGFGVNTMNNDVYVADLPDAKDEFRIQRFDPNAKGEYGKPVATVKFKPTDDEGKEEDDEVTNIAVDPSNNRIYVLVSEERPEAAAIDKFDFAAVELWAFNIEKETLTSLGAIAKEAVFKPLSEVAGESLLFPNGIAVDPTTGDVIVGFEQETATGAPIDALERITPTGTLAEKRWSDPTSSEDPEGFLEDEATSPVVNKKGEVFVTREDSPNQGEIDKVPSSFASEGQAVSIFRLDPEVEEEVLVRNALTSFPGTSDQETPGVLSLGEEGTLYSSASITEQKNGKLTGPKFPGILEFTPKASENEWTEQGWTGGQSIQSGGANGPCKITASVLAQIAAGKEHDVFAFEMSTEHPSVIEFGPGGSGCKKGSVLPPAASTISSGGEPIPETEPIPIKDAVTLSSTLAESNALSVEWEFGDGTKELVSEDQLEKTSVKHAFKQVGKLEVTEKIHTDDLAEPELVTHSKIDILGPIEVALAPSGVSETGATLNGTVNPEGAAITKCAFEYGTSLPSGKTASCTSLPPTGKAPVAVTSTAITGLSAGTNYTFKLLATNTDGTTESPAAIFETTAGGAPKPTVAVEAPGSIGETGATLKGTVNPEGSEVKSCSFEYGTSLPSGKTAACTPATIPEGSTPVPVSAAVTGLSAGTKYAFKVTATNTGGTSESSTLTFETTKPAPKPTVAVEAPGSVTETGATLKGTVNPEGSEVKSCSFEYGTSLPSGKTAACSPATIPTGTTPVAVSAAVTGLNAGTKYTFKLTATNSGGTSESSTLTFETTKAAAPKPKVLIEAPASVTETGATLKGTVNPEGSEVKSCSFEYGTSLPLDKTATCSPATIPAGTSAVAVSANIAGLSASTGYTVKLTATNANGTTESTTTTFTTSGKPTPVVEAPASVTETGATLKGTVNPEGSEVKSCSFEYGTSLPSGQTVACSPATISAGTSPVAVSAAVTGLSAGTKYTFKLTATNADGTHESSTLTFETAKPAPRPTVAVEAPGSVTETGATLKATVNPEGSEVKPCTFEYGTSLPSGKTAACSPATIPAGSTPVAVSATVMGLSAETKYTFKLTATNSSGTSESSTLTFETAKAAPPRPKVAVEAPASVTETGATFRGTVNPEGSEVKSCSFEYGTSLPSGKTATCSPATIPAGTSVVSVSAAISGLTPGTSYSLKLKATNGNGTTESTTTGFTTTGTAPGGGSGNGNVGNGEPAIISPAPGGGGVLGNKAVSPAVTLSGGPTAVSKLGAFVLKLHCATGATSCSGTITLKTSKAIAAKKGKRPAILTLATGSFSLSGGQLKSLTLHLSSTPRTVLARTHVLSALATIVARNVAAETATTKASFSLHPAKAAKKH